MLTIDNQAITTAKINDNLVLDCGLIGATNVEIEYLIVAGGGSGLVGGGGGGGVLSGTGFFPLGANTVTVGAGGLKPASTSVRGGNGANSVFSSFTALGGGAGGFGCSVNPTINIGANGGCGGGGGYNSNNTVFAGGSGTAGQGFSGGDSYVFSDYDGTYTAAGGGGGAGGLGGQGGTFCHGNGGVGVQSSITGQPVYYGGGGGGGGYNQNPGSCGLGGAGGGGRSEWPGGRAGAANTGGGGGGNWNPCDLGSVGGSGVVIIVLRRALAAVGANLTYTLDTASRPGFYIYRFTAGTGTVTV